MDDLRDKLSGLLSKTAVALRGPEPELTRYGYADIPLRVKTLIDERDQLRAEVETLRKDAERYRWLREQHEDGDADYAVMKFSRRANDWLHLDWKLDAEIDAAMAAKEA